MICCPSARLCFLVNVIVSLPISIPPPRVRLRLSKLISLNLCPTTGSSEQPDPFPPVKETDKNSWKSKS